jgi:hypothetical protein
LSTDCGRRIILSVRETGGYNCTNIAIKNEKKIMIAIFLRLGPHALHPNISGGPQYSRDETVVFRECYHMRRKLSWDSKMLFLF